MPAPAPSALVLPQTAKAIVFPATEKLNEVKPPDTINLNTAQAPIYGQSGAWSKDNLGPSCSALVGAYLPAYEELEPCCLSLSSFVDANRFVTCRIGTVDTEGRIVHADSVKVTGEWRAGEDLEWLIRDVPLRQMASRSPTGLVGCRVKLWCQGRLTRRWMGRTMPAAVPVQPHVVKIADTEIIVGCARGVAAEAAAGRGARILDFAAVAGASGSGSFGTSSPPASPRPCASAETLGREILRVATERQWGIASALMQELRHSPAAVRSRVLAEVDGTRRTALRLCVDGQREERAPAMQALEKCTVTAILGTRRPYWWAMRIEKICHRTLSFLGRVWIGMPRPMGFAASLGFGRPWSAPAGLPQWEQVRWSEHQECCGDLEVFMSDSNVPGTTAQLGRLRMGSDTELVLSIIKPGESGTFGSGSIRNPLGVALVTAHGRIAGVGASGIFDRRACARLAAEMEGCGPREAASLAIACGANPRALADDGLSPYTAALLGEDPCGLLAGLDSMLRIRILRGDPGAWAEAGRSRAGAGHADMVAAPLTRGLPVPDDLAQGLLEHCFQSDLPLLAVRALSRVDGQRFLLPAIERAGDQQWLRAAERILSQTRTSAPPWCSGETLTYAVAQIRLGRQQFRLLLKDFLMRIRRNQDFHSHPACLPFSGGAECPICFEPLCRGTPKAFADEDGRAVCPHFLCQNCAHSYAQTASSTGSWLRCPECRRSAPKVEALPKLEEDPLGWFDFLASAEGSMARSTLVRAISAMLPVDTDRLATMMENGSLLAGTPMSAEITAAEFLAGGLYAWVWRHEEEHRRCNDLCDSPDLSDRPEWFKYWNLSCSGSISKGEVLRAVLRTLEVSSLDVQKVTEMRERLDRIWDHAVAERKRRTGHASTGLATLTEFTENGGLGDSLEEAFGMDLSRGSARRETSPDVDGPSILALSRTRPGAPPRRRRGEAAPASSMVRVRPPPPNPSTASAAAGVLGLLEPAQEGPAVPVGGAMPSAMPVPSSLGCLAMPDDNLDAMAALEGLERDLALSSRWPHAVVSI